MSPDCRAGHLQLRVASTVGLMSMHIIGFQGQQAIPYAVKLGVALQITNILRDVAEDWTRGRSYLPQDELSAFGLDTDMLQASVSAGGVVDERWRSFMRFQIQWRLHDKDFQMRHFSVMDFDKLTYQKSF